jgi:C4-dicarboxylate transporter DctM subunit
MSYIIIAIFMLALAIILILFGIHIGVSLLFTSVLGMWIITEDFTIAASMLGTGPFYALSNYHLAVVPLFVLMGLFANASGASRDLYRAGFTWFGRMPGGLGIVTVLSNAVFAAVTGVSIASAAVFGKIAVPEMLRYGYSKRFSMGCVAGSSALGMLIPPSLLLILYGLLSGQSIGRLFIAGIVPGIFLAIIYSIAILLMAYFFPKMLGEPLIPGKISWQQRFVSLGKASSIAALIVLVLGGIYGGIFTPTEAGAIGCVGALLVMILKGHFNLKNLMYPLMETGLTTASVFLLFIGAQMFGRMLTVSGVVTAMTDLSASLALPSQLIVGVMLIILMILGTFLDVISIIIITMPIMIPVVQGLGFDLICFGVLTTVAIETGLVTPPFGMAVFVVKGAVGDMATVEDIFIGSLPFLLVLILTIFILLFFPGLATWLPSLM